MTYLQIEHFINLARYGSFTQAAKHEGITQSAMSISIKELENEIGFPLIERGKKPLTLNEYGKVFLTFCRDIQQEMDAIHLEFEELRGIYSKKVITIGISDINYDSEWLTNLNDFLPGMEIRISEMSRSNIQHKLVDGSLDFGITNVQADSADIVSRLLISNPYELLVLADSPYAGHSVVGPRVLTSIPLIALPPSLDGRMVDTLAREMGIHLNIVFEGNQDIMIEMFHAGMGGIITSAHNKRQWMVLDESCYRLLPINSRIRQEIFFLWNKSHYLGKYASAFREYVLNYYHVL